ncbi:hypothetical protein C8Q79DRAFT_745994 [Trametes meyenii]|nr:hypothetical protein C8Q79DRAFT_745994 [Trametes meyenii]
MLIRVRGFECAHAAGPVAAFFLGLLLILPTQTIGVREGRPTISGLQVCRPRGFRCLSQTSQVPAGHLVPQTTVAASEDAGHHMRRGRPVLRLERNRAIAFEGVYHVCVAGGVPFPSVSIRALVDVPSSTLSDFGRSGHEKKHMVEFLSTWQLCLVWACDEQERNPRKRRRRETSWRKKGNRWRERAGRGNVGRD